MVPLAGRAQPASPTEFIAALQTAIQEKSLEKLNALIYTVGMSAADKKQADMHDLFFSDSEIESISLEPLPVNFQSVAIVNGKKWEPTYPPVGQVQIKYKKAANGPISLSPAYAIVDGRYFLISTKTTDLGWKGPPDKTLGFMVWGQGQTKVQIKVKWNASGVDQEKTYNEQSAIFVGQYIEQVTATSNAPDATLSISEQNKEIFRSQPLTAPGPIQYQRSQDAGQSK